MVAGRAPQGSARPSACWFSPSPCASRRRRGRRSFRRSSKTSWQAFIALAVIFVVPVVLIVLFWMVHILPEKIAHKRHHPQFEAIRTLCLLSLVFGGLLWPLAWLWAYSKPVMYKMAYGTDKVDHDEGEIPSDEAAHAATLKDRIARLEERASPADLQALRADVDALEAKFARDEVR